MCSSRIDLAIIAASGGSAPEWLDTSSAPPVAGHVLDPLDLGAEPVAVEELDRACASKTPSTRSERPQSFRRRSGSTPGRCDVQRLGRHRAAAARLAAALARASSGCALGSAIAASVSGPRRVLSRSPRDALEGRGARATCGARWTATGVSRFPGAEGRIPNFAGAKGAAERLARHPAWIERRDDQGQPRLAPDPRAPARARAGQGAGDGGAAAARPAPVPAARPAPARRRAAARGGHDQGRAAPRQGDRPRPGARARPRADRLGGREPQGRARGQGRRLLRPRVRAAAARAARSTAAR